MGIKVSLSDQEASSGDRSFDPMPIGKYHAVIHAVELAESESDNNPGKPMLNFEFVVQDTPGRWQEYANRHDFVNACLWEGAMYTIVGILKALPSQKGNKNAYEDNLDSDGNLEVPTEPEYYEGQELFIRRGKNKRQVEKFPDMPERHIEVRGYGMFSEDQLGSPKSETDVPF
jgi:hypothetical protein